MTTTTKEDADNKDADNTGDAEYVDEIGDVDNINRVIMTPADLNQYMKYNMLIYIKG